MAGISPAIRLFLINRQEENNEAPIDRQMQQHG